MCRCVVGAEGEGGVIQALLNHLGKGEVRGEGGVGEGKREGEGGREGGGWGHVG